MAILIHPTRATHAVPHIGVRKGERMYHVLSDVPGAAGGHELRTFVRGCGMRAEWVQYPGTYREHFDAHAHLAECLMRRGARVVGNHEVGQLLRTKRSVAAASARPTGASEDGLAILDPELDDESGVWWGPVRGVPEESELRLLGDVSGRDLLEIDCRSAARGLALQRSGAHYVGAQSTPRYAQRVRRQAEEAGAVVTLLQTELPELSGLRDASYDVVFSAADVVSRLPDLPRCLGSIARVLRPGGLCALTTLSPFFDIFPDHGADQLRPERSYFDRAARLSAEPGGFATAEAGPRYHRTVGDWLEAFSAAGLAVTAARELEPHPRLWRPSARTDLPWEKVAMLPATMVWQARKPHAPPNELG